MVWVLNDNVLLRDEQFLDEAWRQELIKARVPLVVGVPNLIIPANPLGTLAVLPDLEALGFQTANLIFDQAEKQWNVEQHAIELPLSVKTWVDVKYAQAAFGLREGALAKMDRALE